MMAYVTSGRVSFLLCCPVRVVLVVGLFLFSVSSFAYTGRVVRADIRRLGMESSARANEKLTMVVIVI